MISYIKPPSKTRLIAYGVWLAEDGKLWMLSVTPNPDFIPISGENEVGMCLCKPIEGVTNIRYEESTI